MEVRFHVPKLPAGLFGNLLGLLGLLGFAVCVGGFLTSLNVPGAWWITGLIVAIEAVYLSAVALSHAQAQEQKWATEPTRKLSTVKPAKAA
jgi:hypothetical protein